MVKSFFVFIAWTIAWQFMGSLALANTAAAASIWLSFLASALAVAFADFAALVGFTAVAFFVWAGFVAVFFVFIVRPFRLGVSAGGQSAGDRHTGAMRARKHQALWAGFRPEIRSLGLRADFFRPIPS